MKNINQDVRVLDYNFLSKEELIDIKQKIFLLKHLWQEDRQYQRIIRKYFLFYASYFKKNQKKEEILNNNKILQENFDFYYTKIKNFIVNYFDTPAEYQHTKLNLPGFHIFGPGLKNKEIAQSHVHFHKDFYNINNSSTTQIYSFIIPIQLPKNKKSGLLYIENSKEKEIIYNEGCIAIWPGNIDHSIKPFSLNGEDDYRITWQMHVSINNGEIKIFW